MVTRVLYRHDEPFKENVLLFLVSYNFLEYHMSFSKKASDLHQFTWRTGYVFSEVWSIFRENDVFLMFL